MKQIEDLNLPLETIERGLRDGDCDVRAAAMNACQGRDVPASRTFEPPKIVYKKCISEVIVCAVIPPEAHVRGQKGRKCRASKAIIAGVIGNIMGVNIGVSIYDKKTAYQIGDTVEIKNFDLSDEECSTGFHFFCTREEAEAYN